MLYAALAPMLLLSSSMQAQGPAKLVLIANGQTAITDYPSRARCLAAVREVEEQNAILRERANETSKRIGRGVILPHQYTAFCIAG